MVSASDQISAVHRPRVFISYTHESDSYRSTIAELADWLWNRHIDIITDMLHEYRPPERGGWTAWMTEQVREADIVLIACTECYCQRWDMKEQPGLGKGAIQEGAIIKQLLYQNAGHNNKFFPVLPEGGKDDHVPTELKAYNQWLFFPNDYESLF